MRSSARSLVLVFALGAVSGTAWAQTDEQRAGARTLATEGAQAFNEGRFKDAVDLFSKAESLVHAPPHLLFMARAHAKLGQFVRAREAYLKIVKEQLPPNAPQAFRDAQASADEERKQVEPHIGKLTVKIEGAETAKDLSVQIDGQPFPNVLLGVPQPMDPGSHSVTATATGFKAAPATATLKDAGQGSVTVKLEVDPSAAPVAAPVSAAPSSGPTLSIGPGSAPSDSAATKPATGLRTGAYVGLGVGAVGLVLGTVFVAKSAANRNDADKAASALESGADGGRPCSIAGGTCDADSPQARKVNSFDDSARRAKTIGIVGYVIGGLGVATGVTLFVLSTREHGSSQATVVAPYVGLGSLGVRGAF